MKGATDMADQFSRTALLIGQENVEKLKTSHVCLFGCGGVGGFAAEALARSGVGTFDLVDNDVVSLTNLNRQIIATHKSIGRKKTTLLAERIHDINPDAIVNEYNCFFLPENADQFDFTKYDYVIDAVDTVTAKLTIIMKCKEAGVPVISSMGAGNKLDPTQFRITDIYKTEMDPLAKVMRKELKKRGIKELKVLFSTEKARQPVEPADEPLPEGRRAIPGSVAWVPSVAGLIIGGEVIKDLSSISL